MALSIAQMRARAQAAQNSRSTNTESSAIFQFSKLNVGDQVRIRFINDGDDNDWFWRPRSTRALEFSSIRLPNGEIVENRTFVSVPAFNTKKGETRLDNLPEEYLYKSDDDVIQQKIKGLWGDSDEEKALYKKFCKTDRYVFQGFVRSEGYEKKLYRFIINKDLYNKIYSYINDDEIEASPSDDEFGRDFILNVGSKVASINGKTQEIKDYSNSKWSSKVSPLTEEEKEWLEANNRYTLKNYIPARPTQEQEEVMIELYNASFNGEPYDVNAWGKIFRPDNVFFDEEGNIKDMKNKATQSVANEIPSVPETQPTPVAQPSAPSANGFTVEQMQAMLAQMQAPTQAPQTVQVAQPTQTAPQMIAEHTESVEGQNPADIIANLMNKFNVQK